MIKKKCPKCLKQKTKKFGKRNNRQRYKCNLCNHIFSLRLGRKSNQTERLWQEYAERNQTCTHLAQRYKKSISTIRRKLEEKEIILKKKFVPKRKK